MFSRKKVFFFFNVGFETLTYMRPLRTYTLYSQEKNYVFFMWDKKLFGLNTSI